MTQKPLIDVHFHGHITCCEFLDQQLTAHSDMMIIFRYLHDRVITHPDMELILDFKNVNHISSFFLGYLMELGDLIKRHNGRIVLAQVNDQVFEILELTRMNKRFPVHRKTDAQNNPVQRLDAMRKASGEDHPGMITRIMSMVHQMHWNDHVHK